MTERITIRKKLVRFAFREIKRNRAIKVELFRYRKKTSLIRGRMPQLAIYSDSKGPKFAIIVEYKSGSRVYFFTGNGEGPIGTESHPNQIKKIVTDLPKNATQIGLYPKPEKKMTLPEISDAMNRLFKDEIMASILEKTGKKIKKRPVISAAESSKENPDFFYVPRSIFNSSELQIRLSQLAFGLILENLELGEKKQNLINFLVYIFFDREDLRRLLIDSWTPPFNLSPIRSNLTDFSIKEILNFLEKANAYNIPFNDITLPIIEGVIFQNLNSSQIMLQAFFKRTYECNFHKNDSLVSFLALNIINKGTLAEIPPELIETQEYKLFSSLEHIKVKRFIDDWEYFTKCELEATNKIVDDCILFILSSRGIKVKQELNRLYFNIPSEWTIRIGNLSDIDIKTELDIPKIRNIDILELKTIKDYVLKSRNQHQVVNRIIPRRKGKLTIPRLIVRCKFHEKEFVAYGSKITAVIKDD